MQYSALYYIQELHTFKALHTLYAVHTLSYTAHTLHYENHVTLHSIAPQADGMYIVPAGDLVTSTGEARPQIRRSAAVFGVAAGGRQVLLVRLVAGKGLQGPRFGISMWGVCGVSRRQV